MIYIGIDPGLDGAVASIGMDGRVMAVFDTPTMTVVKSKGNKRVYLASAMLDILRKLQTDVVVCVAIEQVHAMPKQGVVSVFSLGHGLGMWEMAITAMSMPLMWVQPRTWKTRMIGPNTGDDKSLSIVKACQLYPESAKYLTLKKHHGRAEAILIAGFGQKTI